MQGAQTVAVEDGDDYVITGSKVFTTNSGFADTCVLFALTDRSVPAAKGMTAFIVDLKEMPGITVSENIERMGIRAASNCIVTYDKVRVPKERVLGKVGGGFKIAMKALDAGRIGIAAQAVGIAQGALNEANSVWQRAQAVRQDHQLLPEHPVQDGRAARPRSTLLAC